jgi:RNA polymerase sigma-70 factor, ECF subfamily
MPVKALSFCFIVLLRLLYLMISSELWITVGQPLRGVNLMFEPLDDGIQGPHNKLIELAQARDEEAFIAIFNYYSPGIYRYLIGLVRHPEDCEELVQETFFKAWKEMSKLRQISSFKPWLYRIATNLAYDHRRRQRSHSLFLWFSFEDCEGIDDPVSFEERVAEEELVSQALHKVPWKYRACLLLEIEGKLSRGEIATVVKISEKSVGTYISYGREYFRQAYYRSEQVSSYLEKEQIILEERRPVL